MVKVHNLPHHNHSGQCSQMQFFEDLDQGSGWPTGRRCHWKNIDGWKYFGALIETSTWSWTLGWGRQPTRPLYLEARGEHISDRAYWRIFDRGYMTEDIWHRIYDHPSAISFFLDPHDITRYFGIWYNYHTISAIFYDSWSVQNLSKNSAKCVICMSNTHNGTRWMHQMHKSGIKYANSCKRYVLKNAKSQVRQIEGNSLCIPHY